jgi:O-antigen/teichoic acid export membrane protein
MKLKQKAIRNIGIVLVTQLFSRIIRIITGIILIRLLLPFDFGIVAIGLLFSEILLYFKDFGIGAAVIQRKKQVQETLNTAFTMRIILSIILFFIALIIAPLMASFYEQAVIAIIIQILAITILIESIGFAPKVMLAKEIIFKKIGIMEVLRTLVYAITAIYLAISGFSYWSMVYGTTLSIVVYNIGLWVIAPQKIKLTFNKKIAKEIFGFGKYAFGAGLLMFTIMNFDNAFIGKVLSLTILGYYLLAYRWSLWATYLSNIIRSVLFPTFSKIQDNIKALKNGYLKTINFISMVSSPIALGLSGIASIFVPIIAGEKWNPAIATLEILCIFGLFESLTGIGIEIFYSRGKPSVAFNTILIQLILIIIFIYPVTLWKGILGIGILVTFTAFFRFVIVTHLITKELRFSWIEFIRNVAPALISALIMFIVLLVSKLFLPVNLIALLLLVGLAILVYVGCLYMITKGELKEYIKELQTAIKRK